MYLTLCINAENRDEGVENHSEGTQQKTRPHSTEVRHNVPRRSDTTLPSVIDSCFGSVIYFVNICDRLLLIFRYFLR